MKKIIFLILGVLVFISGCGKVTKEDVLKKFEKQVNGSKSYILKGSMQIINNEEKFDYGITVYSLDKKYYKVALVNQTNNHEQVILKNNDGVYVVTPALNKSFKFQSEWPNNSSQSYILESILKDIKNDKKYKLETVDNKYIISSSVNYPNNTELVSQKVIFDKNMNLESIVVYDNNKIAKITVKIEDLNYKGKLDKNDFLLEDLINETEEQCEGENCKTTNNIIDEIIYPLYIPSNTYLSTSEKIDLENSNRVILTFNGDKDFVLVEETSQASSEFEVIPIYGDPQVISTSVAAVGANSVYFSANNIDYYLASTSMSSEEMLTIASSLGNSVLVLESK